MASRVFVHLREWAVSVLRAIRQIPYWIRTHTIHRYHLIDIRDPRYPYRWGWIDRDSVILLACFGALVDYVEKEKPFELIDFDHDEKARALGAEIRALYRWWTEERPGSWQGVSLTFEQEDALYDTDDDMLRRLIKIRRTLWT